MPSALAAQDAPSKEPEPAPVAVSDADLAFAVTAAVETWRKAWEAGNLDDYMGCYAPNAKQGSRKSAAAVRAQKGDLWNRARPKTLALEDMRVTVKGQTARVVMRQEYTDEKGSGDIGRKTLSFIFKDGAWLITQEDWSSLPNETGN